MRKAFILGLAIVVAVCALSLWSTARRGSDRASKNKKNASDALEEQAENEKADNSPQKLSLEGQRYCLVHVGKTAGSKLSCTLAFGEDFGKDSCANTRQPRHSSLFKHKGERSHMWAWRCPRTRNVCLVTLRSPIDRIISWFNYENIADDEVRRYAHKIRPKLVDEYAYRFYHWNNNSQGCFATVNEFAENCTWTKSAATKQDKCRQLAWNVSRGEVFCCFHNGYNYAHYKRGVEGWQRQHQNESTHLLAIRTEHLAEDWNGLEDIFGGAEGAKTGNELFKTAVNPSSGSTKLSERGLQNLCRALCPEIQVYKSFLYEAENLDDAQRRTSLQEVISSCPEEGFELRDCPDS